MMTGQLTVCDAASGDAAAISEIFAHYVLSSTATFETEPPDAAEMARRMEGLVAQGYPFLVVRDDEAGQVRGFGFARRYGPLNGYRYSVETSIYVERDSINRGIGGALLHALVNECEKRGFRQAFAVIAASEPMSVVVHARAGFLPVGTLTAAGWKHGQWIDVFLMQRRLGEGNDTLPDEARQP